MRLKSQWSAKNRKRNAISHIEIKGLFGQFDYSIPSSDSVEDMTRLMVLYGENGCGKTTILKLLYHLLAVRGRGHKTFVARCPFREFVVEMTDGTVVGAVREAGELTGSFLISVKSPGSEAQSFRLTADEKGGVSASHNDNGEVLARLWPALEKIDMRVDFVPDDRRSPDFMGDGDLAIIEERTVGVRHGRVVNMREAESGSPDTLLLETTLKRMTDSLRTRMITASSMGYASANAIYRDVALEIARYQGQDAPVERAQVEDMVRLLNGLSQRAKAYASLGVTTKLDTSSFVEALESTSPQRQGLMYAVIRPYVDSVMARLDASEDVGNAIESFTRNLNRMYSRKRVAFSLEDGLSIHLQDGMELSPDSLSSGEKQLLLLLSNAVASQSRSSVLVIDEPEISLNVKWQRQLVKTLLECVGSSPVQVVLATHSVELLAQYQDSVVGLASGG